MTEFLTANNILLYAISAGSSLAVASLALIKEIAANDGNLPVRYSCLAAHFERAATYCK
jgi:hypothetical protein